MNDIRLHILPSILALAVLAIAGTESNLSQNTLAFADTNTVEIRLANERGEPVGNASVSMELREAGILGYSSTHIALRHTANGVYESRNPVPSGSTFEIHLSIDAPGHQAYRRVLTQSGPVRNSYSAQLSPRTADEDDQPAWQLQMDPQDLSWDFQDDPPPGEGTVVDDPGSLYDATYTHTQPATISAAPEGATLSGRVQADIEGHWNPSYPEGLVFALSPDKQHVLGFSYTSRYPHSGYFRIDELPMTGDIILISFMPQVKRLHWMDVVSMDEVVDASKRHDSYSLGTVWAHLRRPAGGAPHDLSSAGAGALKGAGYALQLMVLTGWISERAMNRQDFTVIDELTNRLYDKYRDGIENHIFRADHAEGRLFSEFDFPIRLNVPYEVAGSRLHKLYFMSPDGQELIVQQSDGDVIAPIPYGYGIKRLLPAGDGQANSFLVQWESGGIYNSHLLFGKDDQGRYFVDYTRDVTDDPTRYFSTAKQGPEACGQASAAEVASSYFAPACAIDSASYKPVATLELNRSGRLAYVFASCAGPQTRGTFTYVIIERRLKCQVIGSFSTRDPGPDISIDLPGLRSFDDKPLDYAKIYPLIVSASDMQMRYEFDVSSQTYRQVAARPARQQETPQERSKHFTTFGPFALTVEHFAHDADWSSIVNNLMGEGYRVADWNDLVAYHAKGHDLLEMLDGLGVRERGGIGSVTRNGDRRWRGNRFFFASRHDHNRPGNYLAHSNIDNHLVSLGSWWGERRILAIREDYAANVHWQRDTRTAVVDVRNPQTGRVWMDRNLGASRAATSSSDLQAYGDLYQWGRAADGHQRRNSQTTSTLSSSDQPSHGSFILAPNSPWDWRSPQNNNLWQGVNGINNPCPAGYRLPTDAEWEEERRSWINDNAIGAFDSPLKLPMAGHRGASSGSLFVVGSDGSYWSSTVSGSFARNLGFGSSSAGMVGNGRAFGDSVRCLKD